MYVDERVGDKPNETQRERDRERKREEEVRSVRKMETCNIRECVCIRILYTWKEKRQQV